MTATPTTEIALVESPGGWLAEVAVFNHNERVILDTGSSALVLDSSRRQHASASLRSIYGVDSGGSRETMQVAQDVPVRFGTLHVRLPYVLYSRLDAQLTANIGVSGFLNPQQLTTYGAVLLDFPRRRLSVYASTDAMQEAIGHALPGARIYRAAVDVRNGVPFVRAHIGTAGDALLKLDTGASMTVVPKDFFKGQKASGTTTFQGFSGAQHSVRIFSKQPITLGDLTLAPAVVQEAATSATSVLGRNALAGYAIAFPQGPVTEVWLFRS